MVDGHAEFVRRCNSLDNALRADGFVLEVAEVEALVWVSLAVEGELHGVSPELVEHCERRAAERAADAAA